MQFTINMKEVKDRMNNILDIKRCSVSKLGGGNGSALQQKMNRQLNGDSALTVDVLCAFLAMFQDVSPEWILFGVEPIYKESAGTPTHNVHVDTMSGGTAIAGNVSSAADTSRDAMITQLLEQNNRLIQYLTSK